MNPDSLMTLAEYEACLRADFSTFIHRAFEELNPHTEYMESLYIDLIASKLEACRNGQIRRLIINLPPRTLKSHIASVAFVAWLLGHKPSIQVICASYGQDLADKHARDCRTILQSSFFRRLFPRTKLASDRHAVNDFATTDKGCRMATSVGGVLTGRGADMIILDDVMKPDDALSDTRRKAANDWYRNTLLSRLNSKADGVIIVVMQRLHQDDIIGHLLEAEQNWELLSLAAIAEEEERHAISTPFGHAVFERSPGQVLHPERDSRETLEQSRQSVGEYNFQSQYQQCPVPLEGGYIKRDWIQYYDPSELPQSFTFVLQSWDTANKSGELNDFSVCTTWGCYNDRYYLLDVFRKRLNYPDLRRAVVEQCKLHQPLETVIEEKSSGISLIQDLEAEGVYQIRAYKPPAGSDKIMRLGAQSIKFEAGKVLLPRQAHWLDEYVRELTGFPGTKYDDQVDSTAQALAHFTEKTQGLAVWARLG